MSRANTQAGSAYITVLAVFLAVLSLVMVPLTLTAISRDITSRYSSFSGIYEMAVAGNESVLFIAKDAASGVLRDAHVLTEFTQTIGADGKVFCFHPYDFFCESISETVDARIATVFAEHFNAGAGGAYGWEIGVRISSNNLEDRFVGSTIATKTAHGYLIRTSVRKFASALSRVAVVESVITWDVPAKSDDKSNSEGLINCLDYYTPTMLELKRISN